MAILNCFLDRDASLRLTEITIRTGLHKSTAYRLLEAMRQHGVVCMDPATGNYRPGLRLFELGMRAVGQLDLSRAAYPVLDTLVERTGETAHLCVLDGVDVVYLAKVESKHALRIPSGIGRRNPAYCTAVGKVILAALPDCELTALLERFDFALRTRNTIRNVPDLKRDLRLTRLRGYAIDNQEIDESVRCIAAAVRDYTGEVVAAMSIAGPTVRLTKEAIPSLAIHVVDATKTLSDQLGYRPSVMASGAGTGISRRWRGASLSAGDGSDAQK